MYARLFSIQAPETESDAGGILVFGIDLEDEAVTYRRDPKTRKTLFGVHDSADRVLTFHRRQFPGVDLRLVWEDAWDLLDASLS